MSSSFSQLTEQVRQQSKKLRLKATRFSESFLGTETTATLGVRFLGWSKIRMIALCSPQVITLSAEKVVIKIKLSAFTKNHWGSMYFGALAVGADISGGLLAWKLIQDSGEDVGLLFKDFSAKFSRRPQNDVYFVCDEGALVVSLMQKTLETSERQNQSLKIVAFARPEGESGLPDFLDNTHRVAEFEVTLSLKRR
jgi:hypothetical protein